MHVDVTLLIDIILAIVAGWLGGLAARRVGLPLVVGYIFAGILIGPHLLAAVGDGAHVRLLATLGVVFLLFAQGLELARHTLLRLGKDEELVQGYVDQVRLFRYRSDRLREARRIPRMRNIMRDSRWDTI